MTEPRPGRWGSRACCDGWDARVRLFLHNPVDLGPALLVATLLILGLVGLIRRDLLVAALVTAPLAAQLLASAAGVLPLSGRLVLGYVPLVLLILAAAPIALEHGRPSIIVAAATAALIGVLAPGVFTATESAASPLRFDELRPVMQQVAGLERPGDLVFNHFALSVPISLYQRLGVHLATNGSMYTRKASRCDDAVLLRRAGALGHRVWFIGLRANPRTPPEALQTEFRQQSDQIRDRLRVDGHQLADIRSPGAEAILVTIPATLPNQPYAGNTACLTATRTK